MNEAAAAERQAAVDHERELCQRRLSEMSSHVEHQLHDGRLRQAAQFAGEREAAEEARRREVSRLEADLRDARKKDAPWTRLVSGTMSKRSAHWAAEESDKSDDEDEEEDLGSTSSDSDETAGEEEEVKRDQWTR